MWRIDPASLDHYLAHSGYEAFRAALRLAPEAIVQVVKEAHLRGRGAPATRPA